MDTPVNLSRAPRRKLKRVLKKNKISSNFSLNSSSHSLYQKKLKTAINTSLNLSSNVRTLQANNRSLALQVAKLREEMRRVFNEHMNLLQHNHNLNERILELERQLDMAPSIIEHEVHSRCQAKGQIMQAHLDLLLENASIFTKGLTELKELWAASPRKSENSVSALSFRRSTRSSNDVNLTARAIYNTGSTLAEKNWITDISDEDNEGLLQSPGVSERGFVQMSMVMEASYLENQPASADVPLLQEDLQEEDEKTASCVTSCSPQRKLVSRLETRNSIPAMDKLSREEDVTPPMITLRRSDRRNTYLVAEKQSPTQNGPEKLQDLVDVTSPKMFDSLQNNHILTQSEAAQESQSKEKNSFQQGVNKSSFKTKKNEALKSPHHHICNAFELMSAHKEWLKKYGANSATQNPLVASPTPESPCGEKTSYSLKDMDLTTGIFDESFTQRTNFPKIISPTDLEDNPPDAKVSSKKRLKADKTVNSSEPQESPSLSSESVSGEDKAEDRKPVEEYLSAVGRSRGRHASGTNNEDTESNIEATSVPGAVTMRVSKGGKLVFAVSRKGADGSRAVVETSLRARSKPKKVQKALEETMVKPSGEDVQNIFDFHDKTPKSLQQNQHQSSMSVFSLSADESAFSPLGTLNKLRESNKDNSVRTNASKVSKENEKFVSDKDATNSSPVVERSRSSRSVFRSRSRLKKKNFEEHEIDNESLQCQSKEQDENSGRLSQQNDIENSFCALSLPDKGIASTFVGEVYMEPLKGSPEVRPCYRTRSQSRGRRRTGSCKQSPEGTRKVRSKSTASAGSPAQERSRSRVRNKDRRLADPDKEITGSITERSFPNKDELPVSELKAGNVVNNHIIAEKSSFKAKDKLSNSPFEVVRKSRSPQSPRGTERIRKSRSTVRISRGRNCSQIASVEEKNQHAPYDSTRKQSGDAINSIMDNETHLKSAEATDMKSVPNSIEIRSSLGDDATYTNKILHNNKTQICGKTIDNENRKCKLSDGDAIMRSRSTADCTEREIKISSSSPSHKSRKELFNKLSKPSKNNVKECSILVVNQPSPDPVGHMTGEQQKTDTSIKRRTANRQGKSAHKKKTEEAPGASPGVKAAKTSPEQDYQLEARPSPERISLRWKARDDKQVCSPSFVEESHDKTQSQRKGKYEEKQIEEADISSMSTTPNNDEQKVSCFTKLGIRSLSQQNCSVKNIEVSDQLRSNDFQTYAASPGRKTSSKQRLKKALKSASKKNKKPQDQAQEQGNPVQEKKSEDKPDDHGSKEDSILSHFTTVQKNTSTSPAVSCNGDHTTSSFSQQDHVDIPSGASSSFFHKAPKISKIVENNCNLFNFCTDPKSHSPNREGRKRRAASNVSYVPPRLNSKLRRGDPFTSHYAAEAISIYRSPKSKAKEKARLRRDVLGSLHNLAIKEDPDTADDE